MLTTLENGSITVSFLKSVLLKRWTSQTRAIVYMVRRLSCENELLVQLNLMFYKYELKSILRNDHQHIIQSSCNHHDHSKPGNRKNSPSTCNIPSGVFKFKEPQWFAPNSSCRTSESISCCRKEQGRISVTS